MASPLADRLTRIAGGDGDAREAMPGLVAIIIRDRTIATQIAIGLRTVSPPAQMRVSTKMRVASISKLAAALAVMQCIETGALALDAPIDLGFPLRNPAFPYAPITIRQLLTHTSSLRDGDVYWGTLGETLADFFTPAGAHWENGGHFDPRHPPGAYYTYCNLAYGVLASLVERATGRRFDLYAHERVLAPASITGGFNWSEVDPGDIAEGATLYRPGPDGSWAASVDAPGAPRIGPSFTLPGARLDAYRAGDNGLLFSPQGGLRASVLEIARLGLLLMHGGTLDGVRLLAPETVAAMTKPEWRFDAPAGNGDPYGGVVTAQGLGVQILEPASSPIAAQKRPLAGHAAEAYGLLGGLWLDLEAGAGFVYLLTGGPDARTPGRKGFFAIEETLMATLYEAALG